MRYALIISRQLLIAAEAMRAARLRYAYVAAARHDAATRAIAARAIYEYSHATMPLDTMMSAATPAIDKIRCRYGAFLRYAVRAL